MEPSNFDRDAWQELRQTIRDSDSQSLTSLLSKHPELVRHHTSLDSLLHLAAYEGHRNVVQTLIDLGADIDLDIEDCGTPLDEAASQGHFEVVQYLVERGASVITPRPERNPLFGAIDSGRADIATFLLDTGIDPHVVYRGESGGLKNALSYALEDGQTEIADLLTKAGCHLPIEGIDKPISLLEKNPAPTGVPSGTHEQIIARMTTLFGPVDPLALQELIPVHEDLEVAIHRIQPNDRHPCLTLFTTGMSDRPMNVPKGEGAFQYAELIMHLPASWRTDSSAAKSDKWSWPLRWLRKVAYYPHITDTSLSGPCTIITPSDPPVPLGPNTKQTCLLLIADFSDWSPMVLDDKRHVHFYTVIPLYTEERDFEKQHGIAPLLQRLEEQGYTSVVSVNRANVATE